MTDTEIKIFIAKEVLENIPDKSVSISLRRILFNEHNTINWESALKTTLLHMPELRNKIANKQ